MSSVIVLAAPTGPTGQFKQVNIFDGPTGPVGLFATCVQLDGFTGPSGTFKTVVDNGEDHIAGFETIIIDGFTR